MIRLVQQLGIPLMAYGIWLTYAAYTGTKEAEPKKPSRPALEPARLLLGGLRLRR